ncbi:Translin [Rhypophila sp. PSN 637]
MATPLIDPELFSQLKAKIEADSLVKKDLDQIVDDLNQNVAYTQGVLSRIHSTPRSKCLSQLGPIHHLEASIEDGIKKQIEAVAKLAVTASQHPYFKYNYKWTRTIQDSVSTVVLCAWLGGLGSETKPGAVGRLLSIEDIGEIYQVPVNLKDSDAFHITIEEYLLGLINIIDELSRLAMNSVTLGDNALAVQISGFIKDLHAGFQVLNLKNDILRKRVDSIKYAVKRVEDVVYDLSLRNLIPAKTDKGAAAQAQFLQPISLRQTPLAQSARHVFPALLATGFLVRFNALVADPVSTMKTALPAVVALQLAYAVVCLPVVGSQQGKPARKPRPGEKNLKKGSLGNGTAIVALLLSTFLTPVLYAAMILFGAPFLTHGAHTFLCAAHLAALVLFPIFYVHGVDSASWAAVGSFQAPFDETFGGLVGGVVGAWLGAVPIPLDWDREWQKWPVTILCGIYAGHLLMRLLGGTVLFGKKF